MHTLAQIKFANNVDILATEGTGEHNLMITAVHRTQSNLSKHSNRAITSGYVVHTEMFALVLVYFMGDIDQ